MSVEEIKPKGEKTEERFPGNHWVLPTDITLVDAVEEVFVRRLSEGGWEDSEDLDWLKLAFREALINAIAHGNLGVIKPDNSEETLQVIAFKKQQESPSDKEVLVDLDITPERVSVTIKDQGKGFDWQHVADPTKDAGLMESKGRGILFMKNFFDSVTYNEEGNEVTMIKTKKQ